MQIYLLGDLKSDNGPGNANKQIKEALLLKYKVDYSKQNGKIGRIAEMYKGIKWSDLLLICSSSKINYLAVRLAKKMGKKIVYLMHGYSSYEQKIECPNIAESELNKVRNYEKFIFDAVDRIICVSKRCMDFMIQQFPEYENKFDYVYNVVNIDKIKKSNKAEKTKKYPVLTIGGGMKRKNVYTLVKAAKNIKVVVVGRTLSDGEKIKEYNNVTWYEYLNHSEVMKLMAETRLYIQNSTFETFCLSVIEALFSGCSILVADTIGCLDLFKNLLEEDIIHDVHNQNEINKKMEYLLSHPNNERLLKEFKSELVSKEWQSNKWQKIINDIFDM